MDGEKTQLRERAIHGSRDFPFSVYFNRRDGDQVLGYHWHDEAELIYLSRGEFTFYIDAAPVVLREGEAAFVRGGQVHGGKTRGTAHCEFYSVVFSFRMLGIDTVGASYAEYILPLIDSRRSLPQTFGADDYGRFVTGRLRELIRRFEEKRPGYEMAVLAALLEIVARSAACGLLSAVKSNMDAAETARLERLKRVLQFIHENYARKISVGDMAVCIGMSPYYFCRFFKNLTGKTPFEYLNGYRIQLAAQALRSTGDRVTDIALDAGFASFSYFIKLFRQAKGCTPTAYRRSCGQCAGEKGE